MGIKLLSKQRLSHKKYSRRLICDNYVKVSLHRAPCKYLPQSVEQQK